MTTMLPGADTHSRGRARPRRSRLPQAPRRGRLDGRESRRAIIFKNGDPRCRGSVLVSSHHRENADGLRGVGGRFGAVILIGVVIIHFREILSALMIEADEIMLAVGIVVPIE